VSNPRFVFGREAAGETRAIPGADETVSRVHVALTHLGGAEVLVEDLGSSNGTWVKRGNTWAVVQSARIGADVIIRLGKSLSISPRQLFDAARVESQPARKQTVSRYLRSEDGAVVRKRS
jgi:pSer/pThr/pTyr-binding forkhead associated (FHA) protein